MKNWKRKTVALVDLLLDRRNPRHAELANQREIMDLFVRAMRTKMYKLADHLADHGMDPTDLPLVVPCTEEKGAYTVIDGNRRVAALKLMATPTLASTPYGQRRFARAASELEAPITEIEVVIAPTREDCLASLKGKHYGENEGIGRVPWDAEERARFDLHNQSQSRYHAAIWAVDTVRESGVALERLSMCRCRASIECSGILRYRISLLLESTARSSESTSRTTRSLRAVANRPRFGDEANPGRRYQDQEETPRLHRRAQP